MDLVSFIEEQSTLANDPAVLDAFKTGEGPLKNLSIHCKITVGNDECYLCKEHTIEDCPEFLSKSVIDQSKVVFQLKLCYGSLNSIFEDHMAKNCMMVSCIQPAFMATESGQSLLSLISGKVISMLSCQYGYTIGIIQRRLKFMPC